MANKNYTEIVTNVGNMVGDTTDAFKTKVGVWVNNRYRDVKMRLQATQWTYASFADLSGTDIPDVQCGDLLEIGAIADAWSAKRQDAKSNKYENKFEYMLGNFIIKQDWTTINASFSRYQFHEE